MLVEPRMQTGPVPDVPLRRLKMLRAEEHTFVPMNGLLRHECRLGSAHQWATIEAVDARLISTQSSPGDSSLARLRKSQFLSFGDRLRVGGVVPNVGRSASFVQAANLARERGSLARDGGPSVTRTSIISRWTKL
jgi:hypothetical protein